jgi:Ca2+-transporting ATPase
MSTIIQRYSTNRNTVLLKGAPERVIESCSGYRLADGKEQKFSSQKEKQDLINKIKVVASQGFRVLGLAIALDGGNMAHITEQNLKQELADSSKYRELESNCQFIGYVCIKDPVRPEVK